jgi:hypothetical protein
MWKTGHSLIKSKMKETGAPLAGEMSGHIFFAHEYYGFDDALYAAVRLIRAVTRLGGSLTLLRSHRELLGLAAVAFMSAIAHEVLPSTFVLYADYRYQWDARTIGLTLAAVGVFSALVQGGLTGVAHLLRGGHVQQDGRGSFVQQRLEQALLRRAWPRVHGIVHRGHWRQPLQREVPPQVCFRHRRHGMVAHGRVAIDPFDARFLNDHGSAHTSKLPRLLAVAEELERAVGPIEVVFGHNDLLAANFIEAGDRLPHPVTLATIKADPAFAELGLVRMSRLSVVPVPAEKWKRLLSIARG